jgi:hypothetical protein
MEGCLSVLMALIVLGALISFGGAWLAKKNEMASLCEDVKQKRAAVVSALHRKVNLVNHLLQVAVRYEAYEARMIQATLSRQAERAKSMSVVVANLTSAFPTLRANETYQELMKQLVAVEQDLTRALDAHNAAATRHNVPINQLPWSSFKFCSDSEYLDSSMEQQLLPVRFDEQRLLFIPDKTAE